MLDTLDFIRPLSSDVPGMCGIRMSFRFNQKDVDLTTLNMLK